jgi:vacuolar iron transporter family protein
LKPKVFNESHKVSQTGWIRAAVLGANDGTISVSSLLVGVAASGAPHSSIIITGVAGLVAGAMSMAAGEYVSVQSQADTEHADIQKEKRELDMEPEGELLELTAIYVDRGLDEPLARLVAEKLMSNDALGAHTRDELGITETLKAKPLQAAMASAISFAVGAVIPLSASVLAPSTWVTEVTSVTAVFALIVFGGTAAHAGGAPVDKGALRVAFWGGLAMAITAGAGRLFGATV